MSHLRDSLELAPYAARAEDSEGRRYAEPEHPYRNCFERDRDRIIHARAFRRLEYKTQVFPNYEGDHFRTRLTHTIEVAQIARTVAAALSLNQTLAEAIALAHDLGHPPFGHAGEEALDTLLEVLQSDFEFIWEPQPEGQSEFLRSIGREMNIAATGAGKRPSTMRMT